MQTQSIHSVDTYWVRIYLAGDVAVIRQACREFCYHHGLCVTVTATDYIYTGGGEPGAIVELVNYPRFPTDRATLRAKAGLLADALQRAACQDSVLIVTPEQTEWRTRR